jgi:hypothetical protein
MKDKTNIIYCALGLLLVVVVIFDVMSGNVMLSPDEYYDYYGEEYYDDMYGEYYMDYEDYVEVYDDYYGDEYDDYYEDEYEENGVIQRSGNFVNVNSGSTGGLNEACGPGEECASGQCATKSCVCYTAPSDTEGTCKLEWGEACMSNDDCVDFCMINVTGIDTCGPCQNVEGCDYGCEPICTFDSDNLKVECEFPDGRVCNYFPNSENRQSHCEYADGSSCDFRDDAENTASRCDFTETSYCTYDNDGDQLSCVLEDGTVCGQNSVNPQSMDCTQTNGDTYTWTDNGDGTFTNEYNGLYCTYDSTDNSFISGDSECEDVAGGDEEDEYEGSSYFDGDDFMMCENLGASGATRDADIAPTMIGD